MTENGLAIARELTDKNNIASKEVCILVIIQLPVSMVKINLASAGSSINACRGNVYALVVSKSFTR